LEEIMPSVQEILRQAGIGDETITSFGPKAIEAFGNVLTEAQAAREAAELAQRSNVDFYQNQIAPSLVAWEEEKQRLDNDRARIASEAAFYRTQAEQARAYGFLPSDAPTGFQPRDGQGRYVASFPGATPGSPTFTGTSPSTGNGVTMEQIDQRLGTGLSNFAWAMQEYQQLNEGKYLPDSIDQLAQEATNSRQSFRDYVTRKYDFQGKRAALQKQEQEHHDQKIRDEATRAADQRWAERVGSNPDMRMAQTNPRMTDIARATRAGQLPDPLMLNDEQRRQATRMAIHKDLSEAQ
jgi:hypothetical protein